MIGPSREVKGGISAVVNIYFEAGLGEIIDLTYMKTMEDGNKFRKLMIAITALLKFLFIVNKFEIIHFHLGSIASFYRKSIFIYIAKKFNKKIIIHLHGGDFHEFYHPGINMQQKKYINKIFGLADVVIALTVFWKDFLSGIVDGNKVSVIYNGVPIPACHEKNYSNIQILFLGRVVKSKGIFDLLDIMPEIVTQFQEVKLYILGDGDRKHLQKIIQKYNLQDNVELLGWVTGAEKEEYLQSSTIFVLPSYNEGLPMSLLEAMSYKCAAVTTNVGGIPEVISHGENGYMVEPGDVKELKNTIIELLKDRSKRERIGEQAYNDIISIYSCNKSIEKLLKVYNAISQEREEEQEFINVKVGRMRFE